MKNVLRELTVSLAPKILPSNKFLEKMLSISVLARNYAEIFTTKKFPTREDLWLDGIGRFSKERVIYLEFGVWKGESIRWFAENILNKDSKFYGFDSFYGLPEQWDMMTTTYESGMFSVDGIFPEIRDERVSFIKGWFQNTVHNFVKRNESELNDNLIVHYDADLYSSTLLCLMEVDLLKKKYLAIFDEFPGHEARALYNYQQLSGAKVEFIGRVGPSMRYPVQVMALITPQKEFDIPR